MSDTFVTLHGWVGSDVTYRNPHDISVVNFRVASTPRLKKEGKWIDGDTTWYSVTAWRHHMLMDEFDRAAILEFIEEYMSENALAPGGYLSERGLVSLSDDRRAAGRAGWARRHPRSHVGWGTSAPTSRPRWSRSCSATPSSGSTSPGCSSNPSWNWRLTS